MQGIFDSIRGALEVLGDFFSNLSPAGLVVLIVVGVLFTGVIVLAIINIIRENKQNKLKKQKTEESRQHFFVVCPNCQTEVPYGQKRCPQCKAYISHDD